MIDSLDKEFEKLGLSFEKLSKRSEEASSKTK